MVSYNNIPIYVIEEAPVDFIMEYLDGYAMSPGKYEKLKEELNTKGEIPVLEGLVEEMRNQDKLEEEYYTDNIKVMCALSGDLMTECTCHE